MNKIVICSKCKRKFNCKYYKRMHSFCDRGKVWHYCKQCWMLVTKPRKINMNSKGFDPLAQRPSYKFCIPRPKPSNRKNKKDR